MIEGARILVRTCANVQDAENAVIVTDPERMSIAEAVADEAREAGAVASILIPPKRSIDNEEPGAAVAAALSAADVVFLPVTLAMAHTRAVREAIGAGARVLSMTAFTERMTWATPVNAPILACRSWILVSCSLASFRLPPLANTSGTASSSCRFDALTWFG